MFVKQHWKGIVGMVLSAICLVCVLGSIASHTVSLNDLRLPKGVIEKSANWQFMGDINSGMITICHRGHRRLEPETLKAIGQIDGVIKVEEEDYVIVVTKAFNFSWQEIFPPEPQK